MNEYKTVYNFFKKPIKIPKNWDYVKYSDELIEKETPVIFDDNTKYDLITVKRRNKGLILRETLEGHQIKVKKLFDVDEGDFLIAEMQIIHGASGLVPKNLADAKISGSYLRFKSQPSLNLEYLNLFSHTPLFNQHTFISSVGSNLEKMNFNKKHWLNHFFPKPPRKEQDKIVEIINNLSKLIQNTEKIIIETKRLKQGLIQKLLKRGIDHTKFKKVKWFFGKEIEIPEEWEMKKLGSIITLQRGHDLPIQERNQGEIPIMGSNGIVGFHDKMTTDGDGVVMGRSGTLGIIYYVDTDYWALNTTLYVKKFFSSYPKFVYYLLQTINYVQFNAGTGVPTLNRNYLHPLKMPFPKKISEQQKIATILSNVDNKTESYEKYKEKLLELKKSLLLKLVTGEIRVKV